MKLIAQDFPQGIRFAAGTGGTQDVFGEIAEQLDKHLNEVSAYGERTKLHEQLDAAAEDACQDDWDGDGSQATDEAAAEWAHAFIDLIPAGLPAPSIEIGTVGEPIFEWTKGPRRVLLVSIYPDSTIGFACVIGAARSHGRIPLLDQLPTTVLFQIKRLYAR